MIVLQSSQPIACIRRPLEYILMATTSSIRGRKVAFTAIRLVFSVLGWMKFDCTPAGGAVAGMFA